MRDSEWGDTSNWVGKEDLSRRPSHAKIRGRIAVLFEHSHPCGSPSDSDAVGLGGYAGPNRLLGDVAAAVGGPHLE